MRELGLATNRTTRILVAEVSSLPRSSVGF